MSEMPGFVTGPAGVPTTVYDDSSQFPSVAVSGLPGATAGARLAGGTASGPPVTGTFGFLDIVPDSTGAIWVCTAGGTPGTWAQAGAPGGSSPPSDAYLQRVFSV